MLDKTKDLDTDFEFEAVVQPVRHSLFVKVFKGLVQFVLMAAVLAGSYLAMDKLISAKPEQRGRHAFKSFYTIRTVPVVFADHQPQFISYGQIVSARNVDLRSLVSGEVVSVNEKLKAGAKVAAGEALVTIDRFNYQGALREAVANLAEAKARIAENEARIVSERSKLKSGSEQLAIAERDLERAGLLRKRGTITQQQVEARELVVSQRRQALNVTENMVKIEQARLGQQKAAIIRLQWRFDQAERNLENTVLKAPFAGIVRSSAVDVGKLVSANDIVVSMYQPDRLEARFTLTDAQFGRLQNDEAGLIGRQVTVIWGIGGREVSFKGSIERIGADIVSSRGGVEVFANISQSNSGASLRPGAFVEIIVPDKIFKRTARLPEQSVYNGNHVYVAVDGKLHKKPVAIAAFDGNNVLISTGLEEGQLVLATRIAEVSEGLNVREEGAAGPPDRSKSGLPVAGNNSSGANRPVAGTRIRPNRQEMQAILKSNSLTMPDWRQLAPDKRRELVRAHRATKSGG